MRANNVLGLVFPNTYDSCLKEMTSLRSMASVPFGGRYRIIDFLLSAMANCGMSKIGIITKSNYQSLMDHIGSGRSWDLARKKGGVFILPPFNSTNTGIYNGKIEAISGVLNFLSHNNEEYILMADSNAVASPDFSAMFAYHEQKGADITIAYAHGRTPETDGANVFDFDEDGRITSIIRGGVSSSADYSLGFILMRKSLLELLIREAVSQSMRSFTEDILRRNLSHLKIYGYRLGGFIRVLDSIGSYFEANMALLDSENRRELFSSQPVYTKVKDDVPAIYGLDSDVSNSLIADGCVIEGKVINSVLFRGVHIGKGAVVRNCILMQNTFVSDRDELNCVIADKSVIIKPKKTLSGDKNFPLYIGKETVI